MECDYDGKKFSKIKYLSKQKPKLSFKLVIEHYTDAWRADENKIDISLHNESIPYFRKALLQIESLASATQNINTPCDMDWSTPLHLISKSRYSNIANCKSGVRQTSHQIDYVENVIGDSAKKLL
jgi:hypothetical protein